jgi:GNAT superfamily N-acetyltransferase
MTEPRVLRLASDDWAQLRAARLAALAEAPYAFFSTLAQEEQFTEETWRERAGRGTTFAAWDGDAIVGLATGLDRGDDGWHLVGMWVSPKLRGSGVADRLVAAVCDLAQRCDLGHALGHRSKRPRTGVLPAAGFRADRRPSGGQARRA